jgi:hypothetical protein
MVLWHASSLTLTTMALDHSSLRWFEACSCKPSVVITLVLFLAGKMIFRSEKAGVELSNTTMWYIDQVFL